MKYIKYVLITAIIANTSISQGNSIESLLEYIKQELTNITQRIEKIEYKIKQKTPTLQSDAMEEKTMTGVIETEQDEQNIAPETKEETTDETDKDVITKEGQNDMDEIQEISADYETETTPEVGPILKQPFTEKSILNNEGETQIEEVASEIEENTQDEARIVVDPTEQNSDAEETTAMIVNETIEKLPNGAPNMQQVRDVGKIEGDKEQELKKLLQEKDKNFEEKFPGTEFLSLISDLNLLHAYAKATKDYIKLFSEVAEQEDKEDAQRLQERIEETKKKYNNAIKKINEEYKTTEWYEFYTKK